MNGITISAMIENIGFQLSFSVRSVTPRMAQKRSKHIVFMAMSFPRRTLIVARMGRGSVNRAADHRRSDSARQIGGASGERELRRTIVGKDTNIPWCDHTFNPWHGCTKVSPGCVNCYAEAFDKRVFPVRYGASEDFPEVGAQHWGPGSTRRTFGDKHWAEPLKWTGKVFCASMADIFDKEAPDGQRERLWELIRVTPDLTWQLLTKRVDGYVNLLPIDLLNHPRVWKGFTAEAQPQYDERGDVMRKLPGITWCSYEPALGPLTTYKIWWKPDMIVFGGESGPKRRPCEESWARNVLAEMHSHGKAFFMKQMSARTPAEGYELVPEDLRVREFPVRER